MGKSENILGGLIKISGLEGEIKITRHPILATKNGKKKEKVTKKNKPGGTRAQSE